MTAAIKRTDEWMSIKHDLWTFWKWIEPIFFLCCACLLCYYALADLLVRERINNKLDLVNFKLNSIQCDNEMILISGSWRKIHKPCSIIIWHAESPWCRSWPWTSIAFGMAEQLERCYWSRCARKRTSRWSVATYGWQCSYYKSWLLDGAPANEFPWMGSKIRE